VSFALLVSGSSPECLGVAGFAAHFAETRRGTKRKSYQHEGAARPVPASCVRAVPFSFARLAGMSESFCEVLIVGGGPAGLSAALVLARARRQVVVCDGGQPRNAPSHGVHGYLTRDGILPGEFIDSARREVLAYGVTLRTGRVVSLAGVSSHFTARLDSGDSISARRVLIATGVVDRIPSLAGIESLYGRSVHHCPYCDGWEWRDRALAVYGKGRFAAGLALLLKAWSADVVWCSDGRAGIDAARRAELERHGIAIREQRIDRLVGRDGMLERIVFAAYDGVAAESLARDAMFFSTGHRQSSDLAKHLGCGIDSTGGVRRDRHQRTTVAGVYVAGDSDRDAQFVVVAAAEGAKAAVTIHGDLMKEQAAQRTTVTSA